MNICVVYYSRFGNNAGVAEYIGKKFREKNHTVSVNSVIDTKPDALPAAELYIFCSPTMAGNAPGKIKKFVKKAVFENKDASYAVTATCMDEKTKTVDTLTMMLDGKGLKKASSGIKIKAVGFKGPLEDDYKQKLDAFVQELGA